MESSAEQHQPATVKKVKKSKKRKQDVVVVEEEGDVVVSAPIIDQDVKSKKSKKSKKVETELASAPSKNPKIYEYTESELLASIPQTEIDAFLAKDNIQLTDRHCTLPSPLRPVMSFDLIIFPKAIAKVFKKTLKFEKPSAIQAVSWPSVLSGRDLIGIAATGSGKTYAFGIPALIHIMNKKQSLKPNTSKQACPSVVILSPTRELAIQICQTLNVFTEALSITSVVLYGGVPKHEQKKQLFANGGADIVIATPGRFMDLLGFEWGADTIGKDSCISLHNVGFFVLDEADRMLDMGFEKDIRRIANVMKDVVKQTVMFSATWPREIQALALSYLKAPLHISIGETDTLSANTSITQIVQVITPEQKEREILKLLKEYHSSRKNRVLVFVLYKKEAVRVEAFLKRNGWGNVKSIHGDLNQTQRLDGLESFRNGSCPLLIATDVAARGIDIPNVEYVINYTYPLTTEEYCHRIGRTGRAGNKGVSHTFFTMHDKAHSGSLINVLKGAGQVVPDDLFQFGTTVKRKLDPNYGAFAKDVDMSVKGKKTTFATSDEE